MGQTHFFYSQTMDDAQLAAIQEVAIPILGAHAMELVECTVHRRGSQWLVRCLVDKVCGVSLHDCARANRAIDEALEASHLLSASYTLEVSSPGLDRPLVSRRDFERAIGEELNVQLRAPLEVGSSTLTQVKGAVLAVQSAAVVLTTAAGNVTVPLASIQTAKKTIRW